MNRIFILSFLLLLILSCKNKEEVQLDYCAMHKADQSFLKKEEKNKRIRIFENNFRLLINEIKLNGFPKVEPLGQIPIDTCKYWAVTGTLIHIAQVRPEKLYEKEIIELFEKEIIKGNLDPQVLFPAIKMGTNKEMCIYLKKPILQAINAWNLQYEDFDEIKFVPCK